MEGWKANLAPMLYLWLIYTLIFTLLAHRSLNWHWCNHWLTSGVTELLLAVRRHDWSRIQIQRDIFCKTVGRWCHLGERKTFSLYALPVAKLKPIRCAAVNHVIMCSLCTCSSPTDQELLENVILDSCLCRTQTLVRLIHTYWNIHLETPCPTHTHRCS